MEIYHPWPCFKRDNNFLVISLTNQQVIWKTLYWSVAKNAPLSVNKLNTRYPQVRQIWETQKLLNPWEEHSTWLLTKLSYIWGKQNTKRVINSTHSTSIVFVFSNQLMVVIRTVIFSLKIQICWLYTFSLLC